MNGKLLRICFILYKKILLCALAVVYIALRR